MKENASISKQRKASLHQQTDLPLETGENYLLKFRNCIEGGEKEKEENKMNQKTIIVFVLLMKLIFASFLSATSFEISGHIDADTTWTGVDTVKVIGNIYVDDGKTLTVDPGIYVEFQGHYKFKVSGTLLAIGTASERITFTTANHSVGWNSLIFDYPSASNDSTKIVYCILEYGRATTGDYYDKCGGALWIKNFHKILVSNCIFRNNFASTHGGAIYLDNCNAKFINNCINNNETGSKGGGIGFMYSYAKFYNNTICNNFTEFGCGGGIACFIEGDPVFKNTILFNNSAGSLGDQVYTRTTYANPDFYFCDIEGGIAAFGGNSTSGDYEYCIDEDPQFVGSGDFPYDLSETSPCINFGDPNTDNITNYDLSGDNRFQQGRIDIGAYESAGIPNNFPGNTLEFDGIDDYVVLHDSIDLSGDYTIELWFNSSATDENMDLLSGTIADDHGILLEITSDNKLRFLHRNPPGGSGGINIYSDESYNDGQWHHLAAIRDADGLTLFVDGQFVGSAYGTLSFTEPLNILLGKLKPNSSERHFEGEMDEIKFWSTARTSEQIRENIYLTLAGTETGLTHYWQFNEGMGIYCNELISGNYGTLTDMDPDTCWLDSPIPVGNGVSDTHIFPTGSGDYYFENDISIQLLEHTGIDTIVVTRLERSPNINPSDVYETLDSQYFIFDRFGNGTFNAVVAFLFLQDDLTYEDWQNPEQIQLYRRDSNSISDWSFQQYACSITQQPYNTAYFEDITQFSQFIICRNAVPHIEVTPLSFTEELQRGEVSTQQLTIENNGTGNLDFEISLNQTRGSGGPDDFGYEWTDSDEPDGPIYDWFDISTLGTEIITNGDWTYSMYGDPDYAYKEISLPFAFFFYGEAKDNVKISSEGYLTFGNDGIDDSKDPIPDSDEPNDLIAPFWTNLNPSEGGYIYYYSDMVNNRFIVQYQDISHYNEPSNTNTFQVMLYENGEIIFQYEDITNPHYTSAGIENSDGSDGLEVCYNEYYIYNGLAVKFSTLYWLSLETYSGSVPSGSPMDIDVYFKARNLLAGVYTDSLHITSNDIDEPEVIIPVTLTISDYLDIPQNVTISITADSVHISWDSVEGANSYKVYASSDPYAADWGTEVASVSGTNWTGAISEDKKFYRVTASTDVTRDSGHEKKTLKNLIEKSLAIYEMEH